MIKRKRVKVYIDIAYCDKCGERMLPTGTVLTSWPEQIPYYCPKCNYTETFSADNVPDRLKYEEEK